MNAIIHPQRIDTNIDLLRRPGRVLARALPAVIAACAFALIFAGTVALRLAILGGSMPSVAAVAHGARAALGEQEPSTR